MTTKQEMTWYSSFFLRLWQEGETKTPATWHGEVESIQTGQKWQFDDLERLCDFLKTQALGEPAVESDQEND